MVYTIDNINKVLGYKTWSDTRKIDELFRFDCDMHCNLGTDSTKAEKLEVRKASRKLYLAIKTIDIKMGTLLIQTMDSNTTKPPIKNDRTISV